MKLELNLLIIILATALFSCSKKGKTTLDADKTYISTYKSGNLTGNCRSCLVMEINEFSIFAVFSKANPAVEECEDTARYVSDLNNPLRFPDQDGQQVIWNLSKTQGGADPNCLPDNLELYVTKEGPTQYNFLFSHNTNEYTMVKKQ